MRSCCIEEQRSNSAIRIKLGKQFSVNGQLRNICFRDILDAFWNKCICLEIENDHFFVIDQQAVDEAEDFNRFAVFSSEPA